MCVVYRILMYMTGNRNGYALAVPVKYNYDNNYNALKSEIVSVQGTTPSDMIIDFVMKLWT